MRTLRLGNFFLNSSRLTWTGMHRVKNHTHEKPEMFWSRSIDMCCGIKTNWTDSVRLLPSVLETSASYKHILTSHTPS